MKGVIGKFGAATDKYIITTPSFFFGSLLVEWSVIRRFGIIDWPLMELRYFKYLWPSAVERFICRNRIGVTEKERKSARDKFGS
jgi:hypothetical protein